jgi:hypothetical protein
MMLLVVPADLLTMMHDQRRLHDRAGREAEYVLLAARDCLERVAYSLSRSAAANGPNDPTAARCSRLVLDAEGRSGCARADTPAGKVRAMITSTEAFVLFRDGGQALIRPLAPAD